MKRIVKKIIKECGSPMEFVWEYMNDSSVESDIRRMKEYVSCVRRIERKFKLQHSGRAGS